MADWIKRTLKIQGYQVTHVKNITDVGHMRQELLETGGDKVVLAAIEEGRSPSEIAAYYTNRFHEQEAKLNIIPADNYPAATNHIDEMIKLINLLLAKQLAYQSGNNIYFDVDKFKGYGKLSKNSSAGLIDGTRAEIDPLKKNPRDFALWKSSELGRTMSWDSPWGSGFPGWHIECSAMATRYLGEQIDIHTGGVDNIFPHHEDEIAQTEGAYSKTFVNYWVHGQHLLADGIKMAKSSRNEFNLDHLEERGFWPLAFRYLCLTVKYRHRMNFTFSALISAQKALTGLTDRISQWSRNTSVVTDQVHEQMWKSKFWETLQNDLNLPGSLSVLWNMVKSELPEQLKLKLMFEFDDVLGLGFRETALDFKIPPNVNQMFLDRDQLRLSGEYNKADKLRLSLDTGGYIVRDSKTNHFIRPKTQLELKHKLRSYISSSKEISSYIGKESDKDFSIIIVAENNIEDLKRCLSGITSWWDSYLVELIVIDNGSTDGTTDWLENTANADPRIIAVHCDHVLGDASVKNIGLMKSRGTHIIIMDSSVELLGDIFDPIRRSLEDSRTGIVGPWGLTTTDMLHFDNEVTSGEADAMQGYLIAFPRHILSTVGTLRECFRFYRNLDLDFSFQVKSKGFRVIADGSLPVTRHQHRAWESLGEAERDELSGNNFKRFLKKWRDRVDLLVANQHESN